MALCAVFQQILMLFVVENTLPKEAGSSIVSGPAANTADEKDSATTAATIVT
jgi:hypothetical protein